jgi:uncharacterized protein
LQVCDAVTLPRSWVLVALLAGVFLGGYEPAGALPPPPEQSAANCDRPTYASDQLVCADRGLLALDRKMVALLAADGSAPSPPSLHGFELQDAWLRRRSRCAFSERHAACLRAAYTERIALLTALRTDGAGLRSGSFGAICPDSPWGNGIVLLHASDRGPLTIADGRGRVLLVASALPPQDDWTPFVRYRFEANTVLLEPRTGPVLRCRVTSAPRGPSPPAQPVP